MKLNLGLDRILVGGKRPALHQDLVAIWRWAVKRPHHQVQIYRERIHHDDFRRFSPNQLRGLLRQQAVIREPWILGREVSLNAELGPVPKFLLDVLSSVFRLQTERMPAQINALRATVRLRNVEALPLRA